MGISVGILSAVRRQSKLDRAAMGVSLIGISAPVYWLGLVMLYLFAQDIGKFHIFKGANTYVPITQDPSLWFQSLMMPWFVLAVSFAAFYARLLRANLSEVMDEDYIRTARAKGLSERRVVRAARPACAVTPIVTVLGLDIGILLGGAILTESVFNIPGIGRFAFESIQRARPARDPGHGAARRLLHHHRQPVRRHRLRLPRSAGAIPVSALLEIEDLKVSFKTDDGVVEAVDGVSLTIDRGEMLGIAGESGSGKSVLMMTVMGLTHATNAEISGSIRLDGRELLDLDYDELRSVRGNEIAMIFQDPLSSLHPMYRVGVQIVEEIRAHREGLEVESRASVRSSCSAWSACPSPELRVDSYPHELSGGMRQRVMIAMALRQRAVAADRRRADHGARRDRAGADHSS